MNNNVMTMPPRFHLSKGQHGVYRFARGSVLIACVGQVRLDMPAGQPGDGIAAVRRELREGEALVLQRSEWLSISSAHGAELAVSEQSEWSRRIGECIGTLLMRILARLAMMSRRPARSSQK